MPHASRPGGVTANGLNGPLIRALARGRIAARRTRVLLDVIGRTATAATQRVRLVVPLAE